VTASASGTVILAIAKEVTHERLAARPAQQQPRAPLDHGHQGAQRDVHDPKWPRQRQAKPVWVGPEHHLRQQIEEGVKEKHQGDEDHRKPPAPQSEVCVQHGEQPAENSEVRERVANDDGPEKILRVFQKAVKHFRRRTARAHLLPDAQAAQRENPRLHAGEHEGQHETNHDEQPD
jgi:hypothetical protein